jgi:hypothetical protein
VGAWCAASPITVTAHDSTGPGRPHPFDRVLLEDRVGGPRTSDDHRPGGRRNSRAARRPAPMAPEKAQTPINFRWPARSEGTGGFRCLRRRSRPSGRVNPVSAAALPRRVQHRRGQSRKPVPLSLLLAVRASGCESADGHASGLARVERPSSATTRHMQPNQDRTPPAAAQTTVDGRGIGEVRVGGSVSGCGSAREPPGAVGSSRRRPPCQERWGVEVAGTWPTG